MPDDKTREYRGITRSSLCHNALRERERERVRGGGRGERAKHREHYRGANCERADQRNTLISLLRREQHLGRAGGGEGEEAAGNTRPCDIAAAVFSSFGCHSIRHIGKRISRVYCCEIRLTYRVTCFNHVFRGAQLKRRFNFASDMLGFPSRANAILRKPMPGPGLTAIYTI